MKSSPCTTTLTCALGCCSAFSESVRRQFSRVIVLPPRRSLGPSRFGLKSRATSRHLTNSFPSSSFFVRSTHIVVVGSLPPLDIASCREPKSLDHVLNLFPSLLLPMNKIQTSCSPSSACISPLHVPISIVEIYFCDHEFTIPFVSCFCCEYFPISFTEPNRYKLWLWRSSLYLAGDCPHCFCARGRTQLED